jgi:predicted ATPase/class 3 adenylate cyclase
MAQMGQLPTGTLTFLFSDIEGSTRLLTELGGGDYQALLERHRDIVREAIAVHGGTELATEGDGFFVVFASAATGVRMAVDTQRALCAETWPHRAAVRVRMGLLAGEAVPSGNGYVGLDVHRAARIAAAGHGGQVLISGSLQQLVDHVLPAGVALRDLGDHRLKDLPGPEHVYQLVIDGLPSDFPPLRSLDARPNNLPAWISSFVGRQRETAQISERIGSVRLLTLTGPGGTGKTRLAVRVAAELLERFGDGCWYVPLETVTQADLVAPAIADAVGIRIPGGQAPLEVLRASLAPRELLLVLDSCEQVAAAGPITADLLRAAPNLRVLATSRVPLHVNGESEYPVPPLTVAADLAAASGSAETLSRYEAVQLFAERAVAVKPSFGVNDSNAPAVAGICARLDGLPLAIELAAARVKLLSPEQISARLEQSLSLLASASTDLPERQRTLNGAIDWSYRLLTPDEQLLFKRLSVFSGGIDLAAATEICAPDLGVDVFDGLASLVDKSLLRSLETTLETRFTMLETIRQYAADLLAADRDEHRAAVSRHALHFLAVARSAAGELTGPSQTEWLDRLEREDGNLRAALGAAVSVGLLDEALMAAGAIWRFWQQRGRFAEARSIFDRLLAADGYGPAARARALIGAGGIAYWQGDFEAMAACYGEARVLFESIGDRHGVAEALFNEAYAPLVRNDFEAARAVGTRARDLFAELGDEVNVARTEIMLAMCGYYQGDLRTAVPHIERAAAIFRREQEQFGLAQALDNMVLIEATDGRWTAAFAHIHEAIEILREAGNELGVATLISFCAGMIAWLGQPERAALLFGFGDAAHQRLGAGVPATLNRAARYRAIAVAALGEDRFAELAAQGAALAQSEAISMASIELPPDAPPLPGLTR